MGDIIKYGNKILNDPINDFDTLLGSSIVTKKTKNFTVKSLMTFMKTDIAVNTEKIVIAGIANYDVAVKNKFTDTEAQLLLSLKNTDIDGGIIY